MRPYDFEPLETSADTAEASVNSAQSDDVSEYCSGENINVEGHVAIDNGNLRLCSSSVEADIFYFCSLVRFTKLPNWYAIYICHTSILA